MRLAPGAVILLATLLGLGNVVHAQGNADEGEEIFRKCRACHDIGEGAKHKVGPVLTNIVGRQAASVDGFAYSSDLKVLGAKGFVWSDENLDKYVENVKSVVANGKMVFPGLKDDQDRKDLIAYLKRFSK
jgi:cytochrome c